MLNLYKIKFNGYIDYKLNLFLDSLKLQYYRRFNDSGLYDVSNMVLDYCTTTDELGDDILNKIYSILTNGALGRLIVNKTEKFEEFKYIFSERSYTIAIFCKAWHKEKIIAVEDIYITN